MADRITIAGQLIQMPTTHGWIFPSSVGVGGRGTDILPAIYRYGLNWDLMLPEDFNVLWQLRLDNANLSISAFLPEIGNESYAFKTYSCLINPITYRNYYEGVYQEVNAQLVNIDITLP